MTKKFRIWDGEQYLPSRDDYSNEYTVEALVNCGLVARRRFLGESDGLIEGAIIEQFTGLLDSTGKEIYEGDIVLVKNYEYPYDILTCVVKYSEYSAAFYMADIKESNINLNFAHCGTQISVKVIGNIHENNT